MAFNFLRKNNKKVKEPQTTDLKKIKTVVVAFEDECINNSGKILSEYLSENRYLSVSYYDEAINKSFLDLQSRNFFDFIDTGKSILKRTNADIIIWGYREKDKIRISFQTYSQYDMQKTFDFSILNSLYLPLSYFQERKLEKTMENLIFAAILTAINDSEYVSLLKQTVQQINSSSPPNDLSIKCMPYILNLLALTYFNSVVDDLNVNNMKVVVSIFKNALDYNKKEIQSVLNGVIYTNLGQVYQQAAENLKNNKYNNCKKAIDFYTLAQKYYNRHTYPYDFGNTVYKLSNLYFDYWKYTSDIQSLRNAVFYLREAQKVFTKIMFPKIWAKIQKKLGLYLSMMAVFSKNDEIARIAIENYKNYQTIYNAEKFPVEWANAQENIGNIYFECAKIYKNEEYFEEAIKYFTEAADVYQQKQLSDEFNRISVCIDKSDKYIANLYAN